VVLGDAINFFRWERPASVLVGILAEGSVAATIVPRIRLRLI